MPFVVQQWSEIGRSMNTGGPAVYTYISSTDNLSTIATANYFSQQGTFLLPGDFIMAKGTDNANIYSVVSVDDTVFPYAVTITPDVINPNPELDNVITGTITAEQMLAMKASPVPLVVNPGAPYNGIIVVNMTLEYIFNTVPFTIDDPADTFQIGYGSGQPASMGILATGFVDQSESEMAFSQGFFSGVLSSADIADQDLYILLSAATELLDGDGAIRYTLEYRTIPVGGTI